MIIWQNCGYLTHLPVKVVTLSSVSLHLLTFHRRSDLHNLSYHCQDLLLKYVCTVHRQVQVRTHRETSAAMCDWLIIFLSQAKCICWVAFSTAVWSQRQTTRQTEPVPYPPFFFFFLLLPSRLCNYTLFRILICSTCVCGKGLHCREFFLHRKQQLGAPIYISYFHKYILTCNCAVLMFFFTPISILLNINNNSSVLWMIISKSACCKTAIKSLLLS